MRRKIYNDLLRWKQEEQGRCALLINGARRVGKSYIVREFAAGEYRSALIIDFSIARAEVKQLFSDYTGDIDMLFMNLMSIYNVTLYHRESLVVFDEVQECPPARQAIKHLVADGRYDYIETGSLVSIKRNVKNIIIPSEERHITLYPMDFEEFLGCRQRDDDGCHPHELWAKAPYGSAPPQGYGVATPVYDCGWDAAGRTGFCGNQVV